jgi:hypothetical protein
MMGLTARIVASVASSARAMPGTARMGPMEVMGLEGQTMTASAEAIASTTPGAGSAESAPA